MLGRLTRNFDKWLTSFLILLGEYDPLLKRGLILHEEASLKPMDTTALKSFVPPRIRVAKGALGSWYNGEPELRILPTICVRNELAIDIGANRGVYAWHFLRWTRNVVAFEPHPGMAAFLKLAFGERIRIEEVALSDAEGTATLRIPVDLMQSGCATIEETNPLTGASTEVRVRRRRLDDYAFNRTGVIKVDVEGHELALLKGAKALLTRDLPTLIVEAEDRHRQGALDSVYAYLSDMGYRGFFLQDRYVRGLDEISHNGNRGSQATARGIYNFIFAARPSVIDKLLIA